MGTFILKKIFEFIQLLHSESSPIQLSLGLSIGWLLGLIPIATLHWWLLFLIPIFLRINWGALLLSFSLFKILAWVLDPLAHQLGYLVLTSPSLYSLWASWMHSPLLPFTRFYNTIVMGSTLIALLAFIPLTLFFHIIIKKYRLHVVERIQQSHLAQFIKATKLYSLYEKYKKL